MIIGELTRSFPTVQIPSWDPLDDPTAHVPSSPFALLTSPSSVNFNGNAGDYSSFLDSFAALHRYLPSNDFSDDDAYSCDQFRMFEFKVRRCVRGRSHDWTDCPYAHPGEKARRRDPRKFHYSGTACPEFRRVGGCKRGDSCEFAHGVFECWLHPARYRTQPCKDGAACRRRVCFFAHTPEQLRILPHQTPKPHESEYGSPIRHPFDSYLMTRGSFVTSPTSILTTPPISPPADSPPMSPNSPQLGCGSYGSVSELAASMRYLHVGSQSQMSPHSSWAIGSPRGSILRPGFNNPNPSELCPFEMWENRCPEEEPAMERVESGKDLRAKLYARLSKENSLNRDRDETSGSGLISGWVV